VSRIAAAVLAFGLFVPAARVQPRPVPAFRHVIVVVFENKDRSEVLGKRTAPEFNRLAARYASLSRYHDVQDKSLPNYLALVSGSTHGVAHDCTDCVVSAPSLADTLPTRGKTWKTYAEGLPRPGFTGASAGRYVKRHNPFLYFQSVLRSPKRLARIVPLSQFKRDLSRRALPSFSLVVPNLCNDMHDCPVATGDTWLRRFLKPLMSSGELAGGVVFVIFDEASTSHDEVLAMALGPLVKGGSAYTSPMSHYGLLRTIEDAWGLKRLGSSRTERPITGIWR
jgi:phosphatidylinositol-3-phosphatase